MDSEKNKIPHLSSEDKATNSENAPNIEKPAAVQKESEETKDISFEQSEEDQNAIEKIAEQNGMLLESMKLILSKLDDNNEKGQLIKDLFAKIKDYEQDFVFNNILRRMYLDLIRLYNRVDIMCSDKITEEVDVNQSVKKVQSIRKELLHILEQNGVEVRDVTDLEYNDKICEAIEVRAVEEPDSDMKNVKMLQPAFLYSDRLLKPAKVIIGKYENLKKGKENE